MGSSSIDEITDFASLVKRSGISIEQCAQGFRMINILKNLGIGNMDIVDSEEEEDDGIHANDNYSKLFVFVA